MCHFMSCYSIGQNFLLAFLHMVLFFRAMWRKASRKFCLILHVRKFRYSSSVRIELLVTVLFLFTNLFKLLFKRNSFHLHLIHFDWQLTRSSVITLHTSFCWRSQYMIMYCNRVCTMIIREYYNLFSMKSLNEGIAYWYRTNFTFGTKMTTRYKLVDRFV